MSEVSMVTGRINPEGSYEAVSASAAVHRPEATPAVNAPFSETLRARTALTSGRADLDAIFEQAGRTYNIDPNLLKAVARVESNFRPEVVSRAGAMGIMQLMPGTAQGLGVTDAFDPEQNIMGGARYLRQLLDRFGDVRAALSAYNGGQGRVGRNGGQELSFTVGYVNKVLEHYGAGDITAGMVNYGRWNEPGRASSSDSLEGFGSKEFTQALTQMMLMRLIEMQMNSSNDDDKKRIP